MSVSGQNLFQFCQVQQLKDQLAEVEALEPALEEDVQTVCPTSIDRYIYIFFTGHMLRYVEKNICGSFEHNFNPIGMICSHLKGPDVISNDFVELLGGTTCFCECSC